MLEKLSPPEQSFDVDHRHAIELSTKSVDIHTDVADILE